MRTYFTKTTRYITLGCLLVALAAFSYSRTVKTDVCAAADEQVQKIVPTSGNMLWESLSSQFISSVHQ